MDDLQIYVFFDSISVISEPCDGDKKRLRAMEKMSPSAQTEPDPLD